MSGVSALFAPHLKDKLGSKDESDRAKRLARMARKQLELGSYDRAALLGLSAAQAHLAEATENLDAVHEEIMDGARGTEKSREAYRLLNGIRNSIAHTNSIATNREVNRILSKEDTLKDKMNAIFNILLAP
jgi:hypothetical protein